MFLKINNNGTKQNRNVNCKKQGKYMYKAMCGLLQSTSRVKIANKQFRFENMEI